MVSVIERLRRASPKKRYKLLMAQREKNLRYLTRFHKEFGPALETVGTGPFEIRITDDFLDILERATGRCYHPEGRLEDYARQLGHWHHSGWLDLLAVTPQPRGAVEHGQRIARFVQDLHGILPYLPEKLAGGEISLPKLKDGRRFSGAVVFLGIFHGLHIDHYLSRTEILDAAFIEPDWERFSLSTFFLDYEAIERRFGRLVLHVGPNMPDNPLDFLVGGNSVTASAWLRVLPGYPSREFDEVIDRFRLRWRQLIDVYVPYDREVRNLTYGLKNLQAARPLLAAPPRLAEGSRIAVVASGPSLERDLDWLESHQERLIILAAHSAVRTLKAHGIRFDFQCCLDTEMDDATFERLQLDPEVPFLVYYKASPELLARFKQVYLIPEVGKANPVRLKYPVSHTHPTTGNLMVAAACQARPRELYLLGLDMGFRDPERTHVKGSWFDEVGEQAHRGAAGAEQIPVPANFDEDDTPVLTNGYFNLARQSIEAALQALPPQTRVFNLADGARIEGAGARRSEDLKLPPYPDRRADLAAFLAAFRTGPAEALWEPYAVSGQELLTTLGEAIQETLTLRRFTWPAFGRALNRAWSAGLRRCLEKSPGDLRMEAYGKLVADLLSEWYRAAIFARTPRDAEKIFQNGKDRLRALWGDIQWPESLDRPDEETAVAEASGDG